MRVALKKFWNLTQFDSGIKDIVGLKAKRYSLVELALCNQSSPLLTFCFCFLPFYTFF